METSTFSNASSGLSIGAILIDSGRLSAIDAEKILREQKLNNLRFGDAAIKLGVLKEEDIQFALSRQFDYPYLVSGDNTISEEVVAAFTPFLPVVEQLRALRSQLLLRRFDADVNHRMLAIVSPGAKEGRSFIAANLAVVFSQLGEKTLLIDADMRSPRQHTFFKTATGAGLSAVLSGRSRVEEAIVKIQSLLGLSVLPAGATPPNPQELLTRDVFSNMLKDISHQYDVIIIDTPQSLVSADAETIAARAGAAMLVARKHRTSTSALQALAVRLQHANVSLVGTLLNDA